MEQRATRLALLCFGSIPMRAFHLTWMAFFVCFFAWFAVAPLMPAIRTDLGLTPSQIANINIAAVCVTILVRLVIGPLCDRFGPRLTYTWLLAVGAIPVIAIAFAQSYESFLFWRLCIGAIGASFVITQFHTCVMFAPNVVGTANATAAGWGNAGGGATQALMPLLFAHGSNLLPLRQGHAVRQSRRHEGRCIVCKARERTGHVRGGGARLSRVDAVHYV